MANVDLNKISFPFKGTYNAGTSYIKNDVVAYTDEGNTSTYLYKNSTSASGQTPSTSGTVNTTYWSQMIKGTSLGIGSNKLLVSDSSGNPSGISLGTAGQTMKVNSGANALEFGDVGGGVLQVKRYHYTGRQNLNSNQWTNTNVAVTITPTAATSDFWINAHISASPDNHDANAVYNVHDSALGSSYNTTGQHCFTNPSNSSSGTNEGYMSNAWSNGADGDADNFRNNQSAVGGMYSPASNSASARTFTVIMKCHQSSHTMKINGVQQEHGHSISPSSYIEVFEIANGIYT